MNNRTFFYTQKIYSIYGYRKAIYFLAYATLHQREFSKWFCFIETKLADSCSEGTRIRLAMRLSCRFIRRWLSPSEKLDILISHYTALMTQLSPSGVAAFLTGQEILLAEITGKGGKQYTMTMVNLISKDGAITVTFTEVESCNRLASITGVIGRDKGDNLVFWIGALQGSTPMRVKRKVVETAGKRAVVEATKDLNGLRPKQAVVHAVCTIAQWFSVRTLIAPSLRNQIAIKNWRKGTNIHTEYETFWNEFKESTREPNGDYRMSLPLSRRQLSEVQQKRRKDWSLRYARIDAITASTVKTLTMVQKTSDVGPRPYPVMVDTSAPHGSREGVTNACTESGSGRTTAACSDDLYSA
jgi:uncharacterized protein